MASCPYCGAPLPEGAAFCPYCARSTAPRRAARAPHPLRRLLLRLGAGLLVLALAALGLYLRDRPQVYDGLGELEYTGKNGAYQLLLGSMQTRYVPIAHRSANNLEGDATRFPCCLYVNRLDNGEDAGAEFLAQVRTVTVEALLADGSPAPAEAGSPAPHSAAPGAALVSLVDFTAQNMDFQLVWTLELDSGDRVILRQDVACSATPVRDYFPETTPMDTTEDLQALLDGAAASEPANAYLRIHLPARTYAGPLELRGQSVILQGAPEEEGRTVFTGPVRLNAHAALEGGGGAISYFYDLDFTGPGSGVGLSAASRLWAEGCRFSGWKTGLLSHGANWTTAIDCQFYDNQIGFHFNSSGDHIDHTTYTGNSFRNNGAAILLERVPGGNNPLRFPDCLFQDNGVNIDNRCGRSVDLSGAAIE